MPGLRKYSIILISFVFFSLNGITQTTAVHIPKEKYLFLEQKLDSLTDYIRSEKIRIYPVCALQSHVKYLLIQPNIKFSVTAVTLPDSLRRSYINMYVLTDIATNFFLAKNYDSAAWYWSRALDTAIIHHYEGEELHDLRVALNNNFFLLGDYTGAMKNSVEGLEKAEKIDDKNRMAHFNNVIGFIYMKLGNFRKSENYFQAYLKQAALINDSNEVGHALYNLGDLSITEKQYDKALEFFNESQSQFISIKSQAPGIQNARSAFVSNKLAQCWKLKGDPGRALQYIGICLAATNRDRDVNVYEKADYFINGGDIYNRLGKPDSAMLLLKKGLALAIAIDHRELQRDAYEQIAVSFSQKKVYDSAFVYQKMFSNLKDSLINEISREEIYQQDNDLQMERQQQLQKIELQRQRFGKNIIIAVSVFLLLTVAFLYNRYQLRQKNRYQKELNRQQNELFNAIAAAQDQERKRIAQDIHDSLGAVLSAAKLRLSSLKDSEALFSDNQKEEFRTSLQLMDEASSELRNISHNIMPATLSKLGLVAALKNLSDSISSYSGLQIHFSAHDFNERIEEHMEISIYRIILELINNVVKHAQAGKVTVQLIRFPDHINIMVEDNGKGFDFTGAMEEKKGIGLGNILSRVDYLKGTINIDAMPGRGTTVIIDVPTRDRS